MENGKFEGRTLELTSGNGWKGGFKDLPTKTDDGKSIVYTIEEVTIPGFHTIVTESSKNEFEVLNQEKVIDIPVSKTWMVKDDSTIKDKIVEVKLLENGKFEGKIIKLTSENSWKGSFKDLPTKTDDGKNIVYDIEEINIPGFDKGKGGNQYTGFDIINAERPIDPPREVTINIPVSKTWKVKDESTIKDLVVEVKLLENGKFEGKTLELTSGNGWTASFKNLPTKTSDGKDIVYDIEETGYETFDKGKGGNQEDGFELINSERPIEPPREVKIDIPVSKTWMVKNEKLISDKVVVNLLENGKYNGKSIELTKESNWKGAVS